MPNKGKNTLWRTDMDALLDQGSIDPSGALACRNCGHALVEYSEAKAAIKKEYNYSDEELDSGANIIKVWCPQCAVADGRVDDISEIDGEFYWEVH